MPLLEIQSFALDHIGGPSPVRMLDGMDLSLDTGGILALVGESGCGKSLTAQCITRLLPPNQWRRAGGSIRVAGSDVFQLAPRELRSLRGAVVGHVFQEPSAALNPVLRVGDQILEALQLHHPSEAHPTEVIRWLQRVGIPSPEVRARQYPHELSGGMQQRVTIAMALAPRPRLLVADEPTTALDVTVQAQILELLNQLRRELGMAILLITHHLGVVSQLADRVAVAYAGQVVECGPVEEVLTQPRHPYTRALLEAAPRRGARPGPLPTIPGSVPVPGRWPSGCRFHPRCSIAQTGCAARPPEWSGSSSDRGVRCPFTTPSPA